MAFHQGRGDILWESCYSLPFHCPLKCLDSTLNVWNKANPMTHSLVLSPCSITRRTLASTMFLDPLPTVYLGVQRWCSELNGCGGLPARWTVNEAACEDLGVRLPVIASMLTLSVVFLPGILAQSSEPSQAEGRPLRFLGECCGPQLPTAAHSSLTIVLGFMKTVTHEVWVDSPDLPFILRVISTDTHSDVQEGSSSDLNLGVSCVAAESGGVKW